MEGGPFLATTAFYYPVNPDPASIPGEIWGLTEQTAVKIISCVHPTVDSMEKRTDVIEHLRRLIVCSMRCEVELLFPFYFFADFFGLVLHVSDCVEMWLFWGEFVL